MDPMIGDRMFRPNGVKFKTKQLEFDEGVISMKRRLIVLLIGLCLIVTVLCWMGIGSYTSGSAVQDLRAELETIYGTEYTGKDLGNRTEDMEFVVEPKTWFLTNWNLRNTLSIDYKYECKVIFTTFVDGNIESVRTIAYQAFDPMGAEKAAERAFLDLDSKEETIETNN